MAKVIMLSRNYPKGHIEAGKPTYFVEKVMRCLHILTPESKAIMDMDIWAKCQPKHHTMRAGKRWRDGDMGSLRIWSGKPYGKNTNQITIAPDVKLRVKDIEIDANGNILIEGEEITGRQWLGLCANDGLTPSEFESWFNKLPFSGQILVWGNVELPY